MTDAKAYDWQFEESPWAQQVKAETFSVGIFQWLPKASGSGLKKSKTIRVLGYVADPKAVYSKAAELCRKLNAAHAKFETLPSWVQKQYSVPRPPQARKTTVKDRVMQMASEVWEPALKPLGFRRTGRRFWRNGKDVCQVVDLMMGRFGTSRSGSVEVELGVFWHEVEEILRNPCRHKRPPPTSSCTYRMDLGGAMPLGRQSLWSIDLKTNTTPIAEQMLRDFREFGLPWLEFRSNLRNTRNKTKYLIPEGPGAYSCKELLSGWADEVFLVLLGRIEKAKKQLEDSLIGGPSDLATLAVAKRLGIELSHRKSEWLQENKK